jgi:hypothetical protein
MAYLVKGHKLAEDADPRLKRDEEGHVLEDLEPRRDGLHLPLPRKLALLAPEPLHVHRPAGMAADGDAIFLVVLVVFLDAVPVLLLLDDGWDE